MQDDLSAVFLSAPKQIINPPHGVVPASPLPSLYQDGDNTLITDNDVAPRKGTQMSLTI